MTKLYAVYTNTDRTDGSGTQYVWAVTRYLSTARRLGHKGYVQGSNCPIEEFETKTFEGVEYAPLSSVAINEGNAQDKLDEIKIKNKRLAVNKAIMAGLSWRDLEDIGYVET